MHEVRWALLESLPSISLMFAFGSWKFNLRVKYAALEETDLESVYS